MGGWHPRHQQHSVGRRTGRIGRFPFSDGDWPTTSSVAPCTQEQPRALEFSLVLVSWTGNVCCSCVGQGSPRSPSACRELEIASAAPLDHLDSRNNCNNSGTPLCSSCFNAECQCTVTSVRQRRDGLHSPASGSGDPCRLRAPLALSPACLLSP